MKKILAIFLTAFLLTSCSAKEETLYSYQFEFGDKVNDVIYSVYNIMIIADERGNGLIVRPNSFWSSEEAYDGVNYTFISSGTTLGSGDRSIPSGQPDKNSTVTPFSITGGLHPGDEVEVILVFHDMSPSGAVSNLEIRRVITLEDSTLR